MKRTLTLAVIVVLIMSVFGMGVDIGKAEVTVNEETVYTDEDGKTTFEELEPGDYEYVVDHEDFEIVESNVTMIDEDVEEEVILEEKEEFYTLIIVVTDTEDEAVEGATVTVEGENVKTGEEGKAIFEGLQKDTYEYVVEKDNYETVEEEVNLEHGEVIEPVVLEEERFPRWILGVIAVVIAVMIVGVLFAMKDLDEK